MVVCKQVTYRCTLLYPPTETNKLKFDRTGATKRTPTVVFTILERYRASEFRSPSTGASTFSILKKKPFLGKGGQEKERIRSILTECAGFVFPIFPTQNQEKRGKIVKLRPTNGDKLRQNFEIWDQTLFSD